MKKSILIAHYKEDLDWIVNLETDCEKFIYSKTDNRFRKTPENRGQEVPMYLLYIIENWDNLSDKTLFLHGHSNSGHQDYPSADIIESVNWDTRSFFSVNKRDWYQEISKNKELDKGAFEIWLRNNWYIFQNQLPFPEDGLFFYSGAQFVVDKELIKQYDKSFWINLYNWIQTTETPNFISSRIFEYTWHYIFTKNPVEEKINIILHEKDNKFQPIWR
jgi:hypothetical protein